MSHFGLNADCWETAYYAAGVGVGLMTLGAPPVEAFERAALNKEGTLNLVRDSADLLTERGGSVPCL